MAGMNLLKIVQKIPLTPPIFNDETIERFGEKVALPHTQFSIRKCISTTIEDLSQWPSALDHMNSRRGNFAI